MSNPVARRLRRIGMFGLVTALASAVPLSAAGQEGKWRAYAADKASTKYSPLDQIDAESVHDLRVAWRQSTIPDATRQGNTIDAPGGSQNTPLMAGGLLYISTGLGMVAALDPVTGEVVWFDAPPASEGGETSRSFATRGLAYWTDGEDARVLAILESRLVALDAKTGARYPDFGNGGAVDLTQGYDDRTVDSFRWRSAPLVVNDVIVVGSLIGDVTSHTMPALKEMPPGDVRGFDVRTGEQLWIFHTIPREGEPGNETWLSALNEDRASWEYTGNTNMWASPAGDEELGYVYLPLSTPTSDYYGGHRPGDNLFAESLVCLEARTGRLVWYFQAVHHGLWDYDFPAAPLLVDITVEGRPVKAVAIPSPRGLPLFKPPYGRLVAIDLNRGDILWTVRNGDGPRDHPAIAHLDLPRLGQGGRAAPLVTKSLVFLGEGANVGAAFLPPFSGGKMFRAYDKATGAVVWEMELPGGVTSAPMTYMAGGRQYIVVVVGWDDLPSEYVALALP